MALTACAYAAESPDCAYISRNDPKDIDNHYFPHETSCNAYYQCAHHGLVKMHCPKDLHFNREINQCGWPRDSECEEKAN
ncbi:unnamed protein product [Diamesa hyperborea]